MRDQVEVAKPAATVISRWAMIAINPTLPSTNFGLSATEPFHSVRTASSEVNRVLVTRTNLTPCSRTKARVFRKEVDGRRQAERRKELLKV